MRLLWLLVACFACAINGRRLKAALDQQSNSEDVGSQKPMQQPSSNSGSGLHGQANHSGKSQLAPIIVTPRKILPILLAFFSPVLVFSEPMSHASASNSSAHDVSRMQSLAPEASTPTVHIVVSVDWEGLELLIENAQFFSEFRKAHPEVPLTHFLNAAYFTKRRGQAILEYHPVDVVSSIDEQGLQIYGWKSLVEASGVEYRSGPDIWQSPEQLKKTEEENNQMRKHLSTLFSDWLKRKQPGEAPEKTWAEMDVMLENGEFNVADWLNELSDMGSTWNASEVLGWLDYLSRDVGYDIDIRAYSVDELRAIISNSRGILEKEGHKLGKSFRVGWRLVSPDVFEAFQSEGFGVNSSALNLDDMVGRLAHTEADREQWERAPLRAMMREAWPDINKESQPFFLPTPLGYILEMPNVGGLADVDSDKDMVELVDNAVQRLGSGDQFFQIGINSESAARYGQRIIDAITEIKRKHGHRVVFETLEASAQRARSMPKLKELEANHKPHLKESL